ncbi:peptidoglycan-binding protein [Streptomyces phaeochromogenes]|uniref:peptidoglycan-binding domain-containing protein n=1 Tax=Streptomyces phaeochromogenes TaxID=1923 RepID=UPI0038701E73|nr:peptidoglycan-binding protein [Streptomyces phaeochromogenes]
MFKKRAGRTTTALMLSALAVAGAGITATATPAAAATPTCNSNFKWAHGNYNGRNTFLWLPAYDGYATYCNMSPGASGVEVRMLQDALVKCYGRNITVDGEYGPATKAALEYAQRAEDIDDDGYYGRDTRESIKWPRRYSSNSAYTGTCIRI